MTTRSSIIDVLIDLWDWLIDAARWITGRQPRPPVVTASEFSRPPIVGVFTQLAIHTRRAEYVHVSVWQSGVKLFDGGVAPRGTIGFTPRTTGDIQLRLCLESRFFDRARRNHVVQETIVPCLEQGPPIESIVVPRRVTGPFAVCWNAPAADRVRLAVIENGEVNERELAPVGQITLRPPRPGHLVLRFTAENAWGTTYATRHVEVVAPPLKIRLLTPAILTGMPGERVRAAEWKIEGAAQAWLVAPARNETMEVAFEQVLETRFGLEPEELRLVARADHGGREHSVTFRLVPSPFACLGSQH